MFDNYEFEPPLPRVSRKSGHNGCPSSGVFIRVKERNRSDEGKGVYSMIRIRIGHDVAAAMRWKRGDKIDFQFSRNGCFKMGMTRNQNGAYSLKFSNKQAHRKSCSYVELSSAFLGERLYSNMATKFGERGRACAWDGMEAGLLVHLDKCLDNE